MLLPPDGDQPAYARLKDRVRTALDLDQEQASIEFKRGEPWESLWIDLTQSVMAMSNLRDGGIIIVGVSQDGSHSVADDLHTYDTDVMRDAFDKYASPHVDLMIVRLTHKRATFLVIDVNEFAEEPVICKNNHNKELIRGAVYVRPLTGRPRTTRVMSAEEMRPLLDLAVEKKMRRFNNTLASVGYVPQPGSATLYAKQLGSLNDA
jgi:predicted HTH transcriptional regulator